MIIRLSPLILIFSCLCFKANAFWEPTYFTSGHSALSVYATYNLYDDLKYDNSNPKTILPAETALNIDLRFMRTFMFKLVGGVTEDGSKSFYGAGIKVDLPGYFMIGGSVNDLIRKRRKNPINTYVEWNYILYTVQGQSQPTTANKIGIGMDLFVFHKLFINLSFSAMSLSSDIFTSPSAGLGWEF